MLAHLQGGASREGEHRGADHVEASRVPQEQEGLVGRDYVERLQHVASPALVSGVDGRLVDC